MADMRGEIRERLIGDVLVEWCRDMAKDSRDFIYQNLFSSTHRVVRFSTAALETIFPALNDNSGYWKNGHRMFYEIENAGKDIQLRCSASPVGMSAHDKRRFSALLVSAGAKKIADDALFSVRSWSVSEELTDTKQLTEILNQIYEYELAYFETELLAWNVDNSHVIRGFPAFSQELTANTDLPTQFYIEGAQKRILANRYERNPKARARCLAAHGTACAVCGMDFGVAYGEKFTGMIEVHHIKPLHDIGEAYVVDPVNDLVPVCPNCHMVIHSKPDGVYSVDEMKMLLRRFT